MKSTDIKKTAHFGLHLTYDGYGCPLKQLSDMTLVYSALHNIASELGMKELIPPYVVKAYPNDKKDPGGYSGFIIIAESHISIHTFDKRGFVSVDIYSCKDFDVSKAISILDKLFLPKKFETHTVIRGKYYPPQNIY